MNHERRGDKRAAEDAAPAANPAPGFTFIDQPALQGMIALFTLLPATKLTPQQRRRACATILPGAPRLAVNAASVLERHGAELPELHSTPTDLAQQQQLADELCLLRGNLRDLLERSTDAHLLTQQRTVLEGRGVMRRIHEAVKWYPATSPGFLLRQALLARLQPFDPRAPEHRSSRGRARRRG